jgi:heme-degrading protein
MNIFRVRFAVATLLSLAPLAQAQVAETKSLTMEGARQVIAAAVAEANSKKTTGVIAVVDNGGNLMALERIDGTFAAGANISIGKARTALLFQKPTKVFEDIVNKGRTAMVALDGLLRFRGAFRSPPAGRSSALWALAARRGRNKTRNWRSPATRHPKRQVARKF